MDSGVQSRVGEGILAPAQDIVCISMMPSLAYVQMRTTTDSHWDDQGILLLYMTLLKARSRFTPTAPWVLTVLLCLSI